MNTVTELKEKTLEQQLDDIKTRIKSRDEAFLEFKEYINKDFSDITDIWLGRRVRQVVTDHLKRLTLSPIDEGFKQELYEACINELYGNIFFESLKN